VNVSLQSESGKKPGDFDGGRNLASSLADEGAWRASTLDREGALSADVCRRQFRISKVLAVAPKFAIRVDALRSVIGRFLSCKASLPRPTTIGPDRTPSQATKNRHELLFAYLYRGVTESFLAITPPEPLNSTRS